MTEPWLERWQEGRIGWHEDEGNVSLKKHWRGSGLTVLVPLCGKSPDMRWIAERGNRVIGVELSSIAVEAFFSEQGISFSKSEDQLPRYDADGIDIVIYCGDFFALTRLQCNAHFDRGALIAVPPQMRPAYAAHVNSLLPNDAEQLVITVNYDEETALGPPFSVSDAELRGYWPRMECIEEREDIVNAPPKFLDVGLQSFTEKVWRSSS